MPQKETAAVTRWINPSLKFKTANVFMKSLFMLFL